MSSALDGIMTDAQMLGFEVLGRDGRGHFRLEHQGTGARYSISSTPSDWRSTLNMRADLERIAGTKLPRGNSGHHPHVRQPRSNFRQTAVEQSVGAEVDALVAEADVLRGRFAELADDGSRNAAAGARQVALAHGAIRRRLARHHRLIPAIDAVMA